MNDNTLIHGKYFRVHAITKLCETEDGKDFVSLPFFKGLGIEKLDDGHYIVIAFVDPAKDGSSYRDIDFRTVDEVMSMEPEAISEFISLVKLAREYINTCMGIGGNL